MEWSMHDSLWEGLNFGERDATACKNNTDSEEGGGAGLSGLQDDQAQEDAGAQQRRPQSVDGKGEEVVDPVATLRRGEE